jgi:large subunit ribosomal protein L5
VVPALTKEFGYTNPMAVPKIQKVVINMGLGEATSNAKIADTGADELSRITGQKAVIRRATKSIAQFKLRQGCRWARWSRCAASGCSSSSTG